MIPLRHSRVPAASFIHLTLVRTGGLLRHRPQQPELLQRLVIPNQFTRRENSTHVSFDSVSFLPIDQNIVTLPSPVIQQKHQPAQQFVETLTTPTDPTTRQIRMHMLNCAVPMIGFGFMDNMIMIQAGEMIDTTLGVTFGLSTLTAAALGQVCSDFSGVCFGGGVEALATKLGLPSSGLTRAQLKQRRIHLLGTISAAFGVVLGCLIGMSSLLFLDLDKAERLKRQGELKDLFGNLAAEGTESLCAERTTIWLLDADKKHLWSMANSIHDQKRFSESQLRELFQLFDKTDSGIVGLHDLQLVLKDLNISISDKHATSILNKALTSSSSSSTKKLSLAFEDFAVLFSQVLFQSEIRLALQPGTLKHQAIFSRQLIHLPETNSNTTNANNIKEYVTMDKYRGTTTRTVLVSPIVDAGTNEVIGCIEVMNKFTLPLSSSQASFSESDEKILSILSNHAAIFLKQCAATAPTPAMFA